jgi:putative transposase
MIEATEELGKCTGISRACQVLGVPRSSLYRARWPKRPPAPRPTPERALSPEEKTEVHQTLNTERFWDCSPREVYATLLDEGRYLCHWRTMYRILDEHGEVQERRNQLQHPAYTKPELLATAPNQVWSWDGRPFGRLINTSLDVTHHQGWVSSPWRLRGPSYSELVSFQGT